MQSNQELITQINQNFINKSESINILEYAQILNDKIYNIDISFMNNFLN